MSIGHPGHIDKSIKRRMKSKTIVFMIFVFVLNFFVFSESKGKLFYYKVHRLSENVLVLSGKIVMSNNITAIKTKKGIVVIDTSYLPTLALDMRKTIEKQFGRKDFAYVINTHSHWDHVFGNQAFKDAITISHKNTPDGIRNEPPPCNWFRATAKLREEKLKGHKPDSKEALELKEWIAWVKTACDDIDKNYIQTLPSKTFKDRLTLDLGDMNVELYYFGNAHSNNDIIVHIPEEKILLTGDLFLEGQMMSGYRDKTNLDIPKWIRALEQIFKNRDKIQYVIPGHRGIWKSDQLEIRYRYIKKLWVSLKKAKSEGMDMESIYKKFSIQNGFSHLSDIGIKSVENVHKKYINLFWKQLKR